MRNIYIKLFVRAISKLREIKKKERFTFFSYKKSISSHLFLIYLIFFYKKFFN